MEEGGGRRKEGGGWKVEGGGRIDLKSPTNLPLVRLRAESQARLGSATKKIISARQSRTLMNFCNDYSESSYFDVTFT